MSSLYKGAARILLGLLAVFLLPGFNLTAHAASGFNLTTSPLPILLTAKPGSTVTTNLRIQNSGTQAVDLRVDLKKFSADGSSGKPQLANKGSKDTYFDWVSFSPQRFRAEPGAWNNVVMTIKVPKDAAFGYYYAPTFSVESAGQASTDGNTSQLQGATAVLVLLDVQVPGEKKQLQISSFTSDKKLYEYLPANFNVSIANKGDIHLSPSGNIFISKGKQVIATLDANPAGGNILPGSSRNFQAKWTDGFPVFVAQPNAKPDKYGQPEKTLHWDFSKVNHLRFGHYTAHLVLAYDNGERDVPLEATVSFWVMPWKLMPAIIILLLLILIGMFTSGRSFYRRLRRTGKTSSSE